MFFHFNSMFQLISNHHSERKYGLVLSGKRSVDIFYSIDPDGDPQTFYCNLCTKRYKWNEAEGDMNLKTHIQVPARLHIPHSVPMAHNEVHKVCQNGFETENQVSLGEFKHSMQTISAYSWLENLFCALAVFICHDFFPMRIHKTR